MLASSISASLSPAYSQQASQAKDAIGRQATTAQPDIGELDAAREQSEDDFSETGDALDAKSLLKAKSSYMGRKIAPTMGYAHAGWLIRSERQQEEDPQQALEQLQLRAGMVVCDMGCGNGFYSLEMAKRILPGGRVLAVDIQQEMLHLLHLRAEQEQVQNIETILGGVVDPQLPADAIDLLLMVDVYHEFSHPQQMLTAIRQSLKPTGRIALLEFRAEDPQVPILPLHKMTKRQIMREFTANGFRLVEQYDKLPWQHMMFFQRDPDWQPPQTGPKVDR
ncbi:MAG: class I SAM-dependent methyltransferase [Pirellulaceae bacterium]|nr:class I SAM-dependent methyltransferase [Pirellulaceae bacterium]